MIHKVKYTHLKKKEKIHKLKNKVFYKFPIQEQSKFPLTILSALISRLKKENN